MPIDRIRGMPLDKILSSRQQPQKGEVDDPDSEYSSPNDDPEETFMESAKVIPPPSRSSGLSRRLSNSRNMIMKWIVCVSGIFILLHFVPRHINREFGSKPSKAILLWNDASIAGQDSYQCNCVITRNRNYTKLPIDAVVINADQPYSGKGLDKIAHTPNHLVVYASLNPLHLAKNPLRVNGESIFNYSMTYRLDSDLVWTQYYFSKIIEPDERVSSFAAPVIGFPSHLPSKVATNVRFYLRHKLYLAMYIQFKEDNATTMQSRYLMKMREHMELSSVESCHNTNNCAPYQFMLIFETSRCPDYVHPQFYIALSKFIVPVLIGGGNLSQLVPPGSYISAKDFHSPSELAQHLLTISSQPQLYEQFFWWHSQYAIRSTKQPYCALCHQLQRERFQRLSVEFLEWWTVYQCPDPEAFPIGSN